MRRLFLDPSLFEADTVTVDGADHHHLVHVLRVRDGEDLVLLDGQGCAWHAVVAAVGRRDLTARIVAAAEAVPEPPLSITVAQAIGKGDRFEEALEHATEVGACAFIPLVTQRTVVRVDPADVSAKLARWRAIVKGAAEQAGRSRIPLVHPPASLACVLADAPRHGSALLLDPGGVPSWECPAFGQAGAGRAGGCASSILLVGPEGGFTPEEVEQASAAGASVVSLGPHLLRTETAALVAVSQLLLAARLGPGEVSPGMP